MMKEANFRLYRPMFNSTESPVFASECLSASTFKYGSGVCALRLKNDLGELILLPFQGQQIWRAFFCGHELTMKTPFTQPRQTTDFLSTYGGFLLHCGATAMGVPSERDNHAQHGELPNIPYDEASLIYGEDQDGRFLAMTGRVEYLSAFSDHYAAEPIIKLYAGSSMISINMKLTNLRLKPLNYMYLCHINFRPIDGSRLVYSAPADPQHVHAHMSIPGDMPAAAAVALRDYIGRINDNPSVHHIIDRATQIYDPEIVMTINYLADQNGYAHSMELLPAGDAFYVTQRMKELPLGLRWISRTGDEDALGLVLPSTAEHKGRADAAERGMLKTLNPGQSVVMSMRAGYINSGDALKIEQIVNEIKG